MAFDVEIKGEVLSPEKRPFFVIEGESVFVDFNPEFMKKWKEDRIVVNSREYSNKFNDQGSIAGLKLEFNLRDELNNNINAMLKKRNNPELGLMGYSIHRLLENN